MRKRSRAARISCDLRVCRSGASTSRSANSNKRLLPACTTESAAGGGRRRHLHSLASRVRRRRAEPKSPWFLMASKATFLTSVPLRQGPSSSRCAMCGKMQSQLQCGLNSQPHSAWICGCGPSASFSALRSKAAC
jgi:hypothetical protein